MKRLSNGKACLLAAAMVGGAMASGASAAVVFDSTFVVGNLDTTGDVIALAPRMITNLHLAGSSNWVSLNSIATQDGYTNTSTSSLTLSPTIVVKFYSPAPANGASAAADITTSMTQYGTLTFALPTITLAPGAGQVVSATIPGGGIVIPKDVAVSTYLYDTSDTSANVPASQMHVNTYGWGYIAGGGVANVGGMSENYWDLDDNGLLSGGEEETIGGFFAFVPSFVVDASPAAAPVPEPTSSMAVALVGMPALMARRRTRRA